MTGTNKFGIVWAVVLMVSACGGGGESGTNTPDTDLPSLITASSWSIGPYDYAGAPGASSQATGDARLPNLGVTVVGTAVLERDNDDYSGSSVSLQYSRAGSGTYTVLNSSNELIDSLTDNPMLKVVYFTATAGQLNTSPLASTTWRSTNGTLTVLVDDSGRYHFSSTEPLPLTFQLNLGDGIADAPIDIDFTVQNAFGAPFR